MRVSFTNIIVIIFIVCGLLIGSSMYDKDSENGEVLSNFSDYIDSEMAYNQSKFVPSNLSTSTTFEIGLYKFLVFILTQCYC